MKFSLANLSMRRDRKGKDRRRKRGRKRRTREKARDSRQNCSRPMELSGLQGEHKF